MSVEFLTQLHLLLTDLSVPGETEQDLVILGAGYVGNTRLIDNVEFSV